VINMALESDYIVYGIPEIHPFEAGEFRLISQIQAKGGVVSQKTQQEPNLFLTNAQGLGIVPLVSAR
jgi:hypothetical protein